MITVTKLHRVLHVAKHNPPGKVDVYTSSQGMPTQELIFRLYGQVSTRFDGETLLNQAGMLQYLPKGSGSGEYVVTTLETGECIDVFFDTDQPLSPGAYSVRPAQEGELRVLFQQIDQVWFRKDPGYEYQAVSVLYRILALLQENPEEAPEKAAFRKINPAIRHLQAHFLDEDLDFPQLAKLCGISYSYFRRLFVQRTGMSLVSYVNQKKTDYAKELLRSGQYTVGEVAEQLGFCDVYYFSRLFKKITGHPPSYYGHAGR